MCQTICEPHRRRGADDPRGRHDFLLESPNGLLVEFYSKLKGQLLTPRTVVSYEREAFVYPPGNVRVTLDRHIRRGLSPERFLFPQSREIPADPGHTILEVKYDAFLPDIVRMAVQVPGRARRRLLKICSVPPL